MRRGESLAWPGEAQRREERRADARLAEGLQRLDEARLYHLNSLTWEQRRLHRDLITIRTGNPWRNTVHSLGSQPSNDLGHPTVPYRRTLLPTIPLAGRELDKHRYVKPQSGSSLQARVQEFISSGESSSRTDPSTAPLCLPDLKLQPAATLTSTAPGEREESREREREKEREREGQREKEREKEREGQRERERAVQKEEQRQRERESEREKEEGQGGAPSSSPPPPLPSESLAPDGRLRTVYTLPSFAQALAEARKARYIRHRGRPLCERELSIREIFSRNAKDTHTH